MWTVVKNVDDASKVDASELSRDIHASEGS